MKSILVTILLFLTTATQAQMYWQRPVVNYNRHEYNAANQNWMIAQHSNGWMYFANNKGLLEYDGVYWNTYPLPHQAKMRSVKMGKDGKIYVGGLKEFGYFTPNRLGGLDYTSLSANINSHTVSNIWNIHMINNKVYFQGDRYFFCYDKGKVTQIDADGISSSGLVNNRLYFNNYKGLSWTNGNKPMLIPNSQIFSHKNIVAFLTYEKKMLIVTTEQGLFTFDGKQFSQPFPVINQQLAGHSVSCASICGNILAVGTIDNGVYLIDLNYKDKIEHINIANGLQNKSLLSMKFDQEHNLWLGLDNGIDYISLNTQLFFLNSKLTSIGAGYCSQYYNGKLYLGTNQGIYATNRPTAVNQPTAPSFIPGTSGLVHCMYPYDGKLFCGGKDFFTIMDGNHVEKFDHRGVWHVETIGKDANDLLLGTYWGLEVMHQQNGKWQLANKIEGVDISAKTMFVEPKSHQVWIANKSDGLWRITLDNKLKKATRKKCYNNQQLPVGDNVYVTQINDNIVIASRQGLFGYNPIKDTIEPYHELEKLLDGHEAYSYIQQDTFGRIWYVCNSTLKVKDTKTGLKKSYLGNNMIEDFEDVNATDAFQVISGTEDGFALIDFTRKIAKRQPLRLFIRKLYVTNGKDSLIYGRSIDTNDSTIIINYKDNSIRIEYGTNNYDRSQTTLYSYRLKGFDKKWSEYTSSSTKEYTDLPEGKYTFEVKIKTDSGTEVTQARLTFRILPPWYRSWWAYAIYLMLVLGACYYTYLRYQQGRERLIRLKDAEMKRQTTVLERDIDQKNKQIDQLEEEKLRNELNSKSDELVKTTLNVVRKNEILQKIKKDAESLSRTISDGNLVNIRRGVLRLITQIDTNIEHDSDLDNFQSSFDAVHNDFFKKLDAQFPQLSSKDKLLCAYIKMNLMSKEIAPLLNISVRGVEISRYRLRKKLGLDEKANLAEYLQKI